jgi:hypothetical protein
MVVKLASSMTSSMEAAVSTALCNTFHNEHMVSSATIIEMLTRELCCAAAVFLVDFSANWCVVGPASFAARTECNSTRTVAKR